MTRDPLEGVRPSDSVEPRTMRPHDALDQRIAPPRNPVALPEARTRTIVIIVLVGAVAALMAAGAAFYLGLPRAARLPQTKLSVVPSAAPTDETVVRQGGSSPINPLPK